MLPRVEREIVDTWGRLSDSGSIPTAQQILDNVEDRIDPGYPVPKLRKVQAIIKPLRDAARIKGFLDEDWSIGSGLGHGQNELEVTPQYIAEVIRIWKLSLRLKRRFTNRHALWVSRLAVALQGESPETILVMATLYERRERTANATGQKSINTSDLDAELAFQPWKSRLHEWEYDQAVLTEIIPSQRLMDQRILKASIKQRYPILTPQIVWDARRSLRELGGQDASREPWWSQAEGVMAYWLWRFKDIVEKWRLIGDVGDAELGPGVIDDWNRMTLRLAKLVVERAKKLAEGAYYLEPWRPSEILKEFAGDNSEQQADKQGVHDEG